VKFHRFIITCSYAHIKVASGIWLSCLLQYFCQQALYWWAKIMIIMMIMIRLFTQLIMSTV